ncbi:DNA cytosine methyltransferase [Candidatus Poriferisodalis sp.]|uniref:DNA cytosine methyltransferase n=1 Tax=Candidatus Poriferisodalis sp. TaxID=3101277 RepID=UPI003B51ED63
MSASGGYAELASGVGGTATRERGTDPTSPAAELVLADFFAGCGGTSQGFADVGIVPRLAVEWDPDAAESYRLNFPDATVLERDIRDVSVDEVREAFSEAQGAVRLFAGCAPCQPFAGRKNGAPARGPDARLLLNFLRFVDELRPELVFVENVPGAKGQKAFTEFEKNLPQEYESTQEIIPCADYGVPQTRRRFVLIASRLGEINLPSPTHGDGASERHVTVRDAIHDLPQVQAGETHPEFPDHRAMRLSRLNLERIRNTPEGGDRRNWPKRLWVDCHKQERVAHTDTYGRLSWDKPAPTLSTRCISYSNGRYGHPDSTQDRALTVWEAARLQTFPDEFEFVGGLTTQAKQIGNAVPVALARTIGQAFVGDYIGESPPEFSNRGRPRVLGGVSFIRCSCRAKSRKGQRARRAVPGAHR